MAAPLPATSRARFSRAPEAKGAPKLAGAWWPHSLVGDGARLVDHVHAVVQPGRCGRRHRTRCLDAASLGTPIPAWACGWRSRGLAEQCWPVWRVCVWQSCTASKSRLLFARLPDCAHGPSWADMAAEALRDQVHGYLQSQGVYDEVRAVLREREAEVRGSNGEPTGHRWGGQARGPPARACLMLISTM